MEKPSSKRLSREEWIAHALETLQKEGVWGLRVEPLARSLGVTPGSFYWHFKDHQDLLDSVRDWWAQQMTDAVRRHAVEEPGDPGQRLLSIMEEITREDRVRFETAIRNWAATDPLVQRAVRHVDRIRLDYLRQLFEEMGFEGIEGEIRARMVVFCQLGEASFTLKVGEQERLEFARRRHAILIQGAKTAKS